MRTTHSTRSSVCRRAAARSWARSRCVASRCISGPRSPQIYRIKYILAKSIIETLRERKRTLSWERIVEMLSTGMTIRLLGQRNTTFNVNNAFNTFRKTNLRKAAPCEGLLAHRAHADGVGWTERPARFEQLHLGDLE